jgi:hypothetical protein
LVFVFDVVSQCIQHRPLCWTQCTVQPAHCALLARATVQGYREDDIESEANIVTRGGMRESIKCEGWIYDLAGAQWMIHQEIRNGKAATEAKAMYFHPME